jgi:hypothetical protein
MSATRPAGEYEALVHIVDRMAHRFPDVDETTLFEMVADELTGFDHARLREFVPVLVEGRVLRALRARRAC